jgi:hypothetical protein
MSSVCLSKADKLLVDSRQTKKIFKFSKMNQYLLLFGLVFCLYLQTIDAVAVMGN